jgi:hypothetical protein
MDTLVNVVGAGALLVLLMVWGIVFYDICTPPKKAEPMAFEEEVKWLMENTTLTREEAEEIANL